MDENEQVIDLAVLLKVLRNNVILITAAAILAGALGFVLASYVIPKKYTSEALMYVENSDPDSINGSINVNDITAAQKLVNTCQILFTSDSTLKNLNDAFDGRYSVPELRKMVDVSAVNNTEVLKISVISGSPDESYFIASKLAELSADEFKRVIKNGSIETVSAPTYPMSHSSPNEVKFTLIGFAAGLCVSYGVLLLAELLNVRVKSEDDLAEMYDIPVFAEILDFRIASEGNGYKYSKYSSYSGYDTAVSSEKKKKKKKDQAKEPTEIDRISAEINSTDRNS